MQNKLKILTGICATLCIITSSAVLFIWAYQSHLPASFFPETFMMKPLTAVCTILCGLALMVINNNDRVDLSGKVLISLCCVVTFVSSLFILVQYATGSGELPELFFRLPDFISINSPECMSAISASNVLLTSIALTNLAFQSSHYKVIQAVAFLIFLSSVLTFAATIYGTKHFGEAAYYFRMPLLSSFSFMCLSFGLICSRRYKGVMSLFTDPSIAGTIVRALIPAVIVLPLFLGWLIQKGEGQGWYDSAFAAALFSIIVISVLIVLILWNAQKLIRTEQQRLLSENALRQSDERLRVIFNTAPYAMIVMDEQGSITSWNQRAEDIFGWETGEAVGRQMHSLIIPERYRAMHLRGVEKFLESGAGPVLNKTLELSALRRNGEEFPVDLRISFIRQEGRYLFIAFINDITDRKKAEAELTKRTEDLSSANKELEQFAYVASHDLQEPLRTISNFVGLLEKKYKTKIDSTADEYLGYIVNSTTKMRNLIKDLLDLSRIGREINYESVDCNDIVFEILSDMSTSIDESTTHFEMGNLPVVKGSPVELKLLFQNLISNALKFRKKEGRNEIRIFSREEGDDFLFSIQDNGIGIEEQHRQRIFVIFQRLHKTSEFPGTGIGLATCKKIVNRHHGKIWVESEPGVGSTFYFTIPK